MSFVAGPALGSLFLLSSLRTPFLADGVLSMVAFFAAFRLIKGDDRVQATHDLGVFTGIKQLLRNRMVYVYLLLGISGMFSYGILANFIPTKAQILGFAPWQIGLIISTGALVHSITSFSVGALSDRFGRKLFAIIAQPIIIISVVILVFCNGFFPMLITYWVFVVGETISFLLSFIYASETFDKRYIGTSMAIFDSIIDLFLAAGPFLGILAFGISNQIDYPFLIALIPPLICLVFTFSLPGKAGRNRSD